ncbi:hypothetical protein ACKWTF_011587 [Chironomus riparius]
MSNKATMFSRIKDTFVELSGTEGNDPITSSNVPNDQRLIPTVTAAAGSSVNGNELKEKVETRLMSLWHNMKYGWNTKLRSNFNKESAIWFLGRCYHQKVTPNPSMQSSAYEMIDNNITNNSRIDNNKLLTTSLHEEMPTSCDSYVQQYSGTKYRSTSDLNDCNNDYEIDQAIEPPEETGTDVVGDYEDGFDGFKKDFISRIWMTYRRDFTMMQTELKDPMHSPTSGYTSDCGWGCMIRSGQMMLAQALIVHFLGRSWRFDPNSQLSQTTEDHIHRKILRWFGDQESKTSPFSIHKMVELGKKNGKKVGEWYGPGSVAHVLKEAVKQASKENIDLATLHVYVAQDCTIYNQDIFDECYSQEIQTVPWHNKSRSATTSPLKNFERKKNVITWKHLVLLIPLRLGHEKLNPIYSDCLKAMLSLEWCIGIIGGRPKHSLYFVGYQDDKLIHLDPHYCQDLVDVNVDHFPVTSFHCRSARKMKISKMDPSCCIGFYIPTRNEYDRFQNTIQPYLQPVNNYNERHKALQTTSSCLKPPNVMYDQSTYPMFIFQPGRLRDETHKSARVRTTALNSLRNLQLQDPDEDDNDDGIEDFVIL